jgi:Ca-activated chloride channel family protein
VLHTLSLDFRHLPERAGYAVRALLELQGTPRTDATRVPLRLSLVLDRSGSMAGEPLENATRAAVDVVRRLAAEDVVSVVAFDDEVRTIIHPHRGGEEQGVSARIRAIQPGGSTNLSGGWLRGRELVAHDRLDGALHRVLLLTDGHANAGITDVGALAAMAAESRAKGITTTCVGFGDGYDEALLRAMADAGGGNVFHIERADQAALAFGDELAGLQTLAGQNLAVTCALGAEVVLAQVHGDWPSTDGADGRTFELGDLYAREPKRLLIEFFCAVAPSPRAMHPIATLTLRADVREADGSIVHEKIEIPIAATLAGAGMQEPVIEREVLLSQAAQARAAAAALVRNGDGDAAVRTLRETRGSLESSPMADELRDELRDLEQLERKFVRERLDEADARYMMQRAYNVRRGKRMYDASFSRPSEAEPEQDAGGAPPPPRRPRKPKP